MRPAHRLPPLALLGLGAMSAACTPASRVSPRSPALVFAADADSVDGPCRLSGGVPFAERASLWIDADRTGRIRWRNALGAHGSVETLSGRAPDALLVARVDDERLLLVWNEDDRARAIAVREKPSTNTTGHGLTAFVASDGHGFDPRVAATLDRLAGAGALQCAGR